MKLLIQCGDHLENQERIMLLARALKSLGYIPIILLYSPKKGRFFENEGIITVALSTYFPEGTPDNTVDMNSALEEGISYSDVIQYEKMRRPMIGWPGQARKTIGDIYKNFQALAAIIDCHRPDRIVIWNGFTGYVANILRSISSRRGIPSAFLERGLIKGSLFIDRLGVNGASSLGAIIPEELDNNKLNKSEINEVENIFSIQASPKEDRESKEDKIFFPLQVQLDTNIIMHCKYSSMREAFFDIYRKTDRGPSQFLLRPHPEEVPETLLNIPRYKNVKISSAETLDYWIDWSDVVVTINSTVGLEALIKGKRVIALGESIYSSAGITDTLDRRIGLSSQERHARLIKYLRLLITSNLLLPNGQHNQEVAIKQLGLNPQGNTQPEVLLKNKDACLTTPEHQTTDIYVDFPLDETLDLTYRKNKAKIDHDWLIKIASRHVTSKTYRILPISKKENNSNFCIRVVNEDKEQKAKPGFDKTVDIYGNTVS